MAIERSFYNLSWENQTLIFDYGKDDTPRFTFNMIAHFFKTMRDNTQRQPLRTLADLNVLVTQYVNYIEKIPPIINKIFNCTIQLTVSQSEPEYACRQLHAHSLNNPNRTAKALINVIKRYFDTEKQEEIMAVVEYGAYLHLEVVQFIIFYPTTDAKKVFVLNLFKNYLLNRDVNATLSLLIGKQIQQFEKLIRLLLTSNFEIDAAIIAIININNNFPPPAISNSEVDTIDRIAKWLTHCDNLYPALTILWKTSFYHELTDALLRNIFLFSDQAALVRFLDTVTITESMISIAYNQAYQAEVFSTQKQPTIEFDMAISILKRCSLDLCEEYKVAFFILRCRIRYDLNNQRQAQGLPALSEEPSSWESFCSDLDCSTSHSEDHEAVENTINLLFDLPDFSSAISLVKSSWQLTLNLLAHILAVNDQGKLKIYFEVMAVTEGMIAAAIVFAGSVKADQEFCLDSIHFKLVFTLLDRCSPELRDKYLNELSLVYHQILKTQQHQQMLNEEAARQELVTYYQARSQPNFYKLGWEKQTLIFDYAREDNGLTINNVANFFFHSMAFAQVREPLRDWSSFRILINQYNEHITKSCSALKQLYPRLKFVIVKGIDADIISRNIFNQLMKSIAQDQIAANHNLKGAIEHYFKTDNFESVMALAECEIKLSPELVKFVILYKTNGNKKAFVLNLFRNSDSIKAANAVFLELLCDLNFQDWKILLQGFFTANFEVYPLIEAIFFLKLFVPTPEMNEKIAKWRATSGHLTDLIPIAKAYNRALFILIQQLFTTVDAQSFNAVVEKENLATEEILTSAIYEVARIDIFIPRLMLDSLRYQLAFKLLIRSKNELREKYLNKLFEAHLNIIKCNQGRRFNEESVRKHFFDYYNALIQNPAS